MNTKKYIADATVSLLQQKKFDKIIVQDILDEADIARSTFYSHFSSKYDVITWYAQEEAAKIYKKYAGEGWKSIHLHLNQFNDRNRHFFKHMYLHDSSRTYMELEEKWLSDYFEQLILSSTRKTALSTEEYLTIRYATTGTLNLIRSWIIEGIDMGYKGITTLTINLLPDMIRKLI